MSYGYQSIQDLHCVCGVLIHDDLGQFSGNSNPETIVDGCLDSGKPNHTEFGFFKNCSGTIDSGNDSICQLGVCKTDGFCLKSVVRRKDHTRTTFR